MTATKFDLDAWIVEALRQLDGSASLVDVSRLIWRDHEDDLRFSGDLLYTWQHDVRWAAFRLRRQLCLKPATDSPRGVWELT